MPVELPVDIHPELVPLFWLIGQWEGEGAVVYDGLEEQPIRQRIEFRAPAGQPYLLYTAETVLADSPETMLGVETGIWQIARPREAFDTGPGLIPPTADSPYTSAEPVEGLRDDHGFPLDVSIVHPHGVSEHYGGRVKGARIDLGSDSGIRTPEAKAYEHGRRMYGLVKGQLFWVWEMAAEGKELAAHVSAQLTKTVDAAGTEAEAGPAADSSAD